MLSYFVFLAALAGIGMFSMLYTDVRILQHPELRETLDKRRLLGFAIFSTVALIVFTGLRATHIGADTPVYVRAVTEYYGSSFLELLTPKIRPPFDFEVGYIYLTKLCAFLGMSPTLFLTTIAVIVYIPTVKYIYKNTKYIFTAIFIYFAFGFFTYSLGIFRQFIAMSIILMGLKYITQKRFWRFLLTVVFAMMFHTTAIITLPLYFIAKLNFKKLIVLVFAAEAIIILFGRQIIEIGISLFPKYSGYLDSSSGDVGGSYLNLLFLNAVFIAYCLYIKKDDGPDRRDKLIMAQLVMAILCQCGGYQMAIFGRIVSYFSIVITIAIPIIMERLTKRERELYPIFWIGLYTVLLLLMYRAFNGNQYVTPFTFVWQ